MAQAARSENDFLPADDGGHLPGKDTERLVLERVDVRRWAGPDRHELFDDGVSAVGVFAGGQDEPQDIKQPPCGGIVSAPSNGIAGHDQFHGDDLQKL
jgi:hypothetical protein